MFINRNINAKKYIGNRKEIVREAARGDKHHLKNSADRKAQISPLGRTKCLADLCFVFCRFSKVVFIYHLEQPHAQKSLLLFLIVFGINLTPFFDEKKNGAAVHAIIFFGSLITCTSRPVFKKKNRMKNTTLFGNGKCELIVNVGTTMATCWRPCRHEERHACTSSLRALRRVVGLAPRKPDPL